MLFFFCNSVILLIKLRMWLGHKHLSNSGYSLSFFSLCERPSHSQAAPKCHWVILKTNVPLSWELFSPKKYEAVLSLGSTKSLSGWKLRNKSWQTFTFSVFQHVQRTNAACWSQWKWQHSFLEHGGLSSERCGTWETSALHRKVKFTLKLKSWNGAVRIRQGVAWQILYFKDLLECYLKNGLCFPSKFYFGVWLLSKHLCDLSNNPALDFPLVWKILKSPK